MIFNDSFKYINKPYGFFIVLIKVFKKSEK